jgi:hypothetical protein
MAVHPIFQLGLFLHPKCTVRLSWLGLRRGLAKAPIPRTAALRQERSVTSALWLQAECLLYVEFDIRVAMKL